MYSGSPGSPHICNAPAACIAELGCWEQGTGGGALTSQFASMLLLSPSASASPIFLCHTGKWLVRRGNEARLANMIREIPVAKY